MKPSLFLLSVCAGILLLSPSLAARGHRVLVDAESFDDPGGWVTDQQSAHILGSPYLLSHGAGRPVADATTTVRLPHAGTWYVYVRTHNWTAPWFDGEGPGAFRVVADGTVLDAVCGTTGSGWMWQEAGRFQTVRKEVRLALRDLTGFDGRCDALLLSDHPEQVQELPDDFEGMVRLHGRLIPGYRHAKNGGKYDLIVVGAGLAGISTAVSAARLGLKVALIHDRPVLGGNNSTEIRVRMGGGIRQEPYPNLGNLLLEYAHDKTASAQAPENYQEWKKEKILSDEENITLLRNCRACQAVTRRSRIRAVLARDNASGALIRLKAPLFADCTGDGNLGAMAGADYAVGRESKEESGETTAPEVADNHVLGASVQWNTVRREQPVAFPLFEYGLTFDEESVYRDKDGRWNWETGWDRDMVDDVERIRDQELLGIYSNWSYLKNRSSSAEEYACLELDWVAFLLGKRESRRLLGDVVVTENDIDGGVTWPDAAVTVTWPIDLHYVSPQNQQRFPGKEFRAISHHKKIDPYTLPYRCLYSRNVENLFMAGRDISVTHVVLGASRVMRTNAMMGEVVGMAASVCHRHGCLPRAVYTDYLDELKALMREGVGAQGLPNTQDFHTR